MENKKNEIISLYLGVSLWVALGDGDLAHAEKALIYRRLSDKFPHYLDLKNDFDNGVDEFLNDFESSVEGVKGLINNYHQLARNAETKTELLKFAMQVVRDDGKLTEQEEFAINEIQQILK